MPLHRSLRRLGSFLIYLPLSADALFSTPHAQGQKMPAPPSPPSPSPHTHTPTHQRQFSMTLQQMLC